MTGQKKVVVYPCGGVGLVVSSVSRLCGLYLTENLLPDRVELLDMHQLVLGVAEEKRLAAGHPVFVIDGCAHQCGSNFMWLLGLKPVLRFYVPGFAAKYGLKPGNQRAVLIRTGQELAQVIALNAARLVEIIIINNYPLPAQSLVENPVRVCDFSVDVEEALGYIDVVEPCIHRPESMPAIEGEGSLSLDPPPGTLNGHFSRLSR